MGIGLGVVLAVAGAILLFRAVDIPDGWPVDNDALGWILLVAGLACIVLALVMNAQRNRTKHVEERRTDV